VNSLFPGLKQFLTDIFPAPDDLIWIEFELIGPLIERSVEMQDVGTGFLAAGFL